MKVKIRGDWFGDQIIEELIKVDLDRTWFEKNLDQVFEVEDECVYSSFSNREILVFKLSYSEGERGLYLPVTILDEVFKDEDDERDPGIGYIGRDGAW